MGKNLTVDNNSLSHIIAEKITEQIIRGAIRPGEKIVETVYAEEFGTSRAPVREALYLLTIQGLVERIPRRGAVVKGYSDDEIRNILEIRMFLESLAVKRMKDYGLDQVLLQKMNDLINEMVKVNNDIESYAKLNQQFHNYIIKMSKSEMIKSMYERLGIPLLSLQRISFIGEKKIEKSITEHKIILKHLTERDFTMTNEILLEHNQEMLHRIDIQLENRTLKSDERKEK